MTGQKIVSKVVDKYLYGHLSRSETKRNYNFINLYKNSTKFVP